MDAAGLKAQQAPLKNAYRETPDKALITLQGARLDRRPGDRLQGGDRARASPLPACIRRPAAPGMELCSGDMLLEALVACAGVTLKAVATALEFKLDGATVRPKATSIFAARWAWPRMRRSASGRSGCPSISTRTSRRSGSMRC